MTRGYRKLPQDTIDEMKRLRASGMSTTDIATRVGVDPSTVRVNTPTARRNGPQSGRTPEVLALIERGLSQNEVARRTGISQTTVSLMVRRARADAETDEEPRGTTPSATRDEYDQTVPVTMTVEDAARLPSDMEPRFVAAAIQGDSLKDRLLRAIVERGPFDSAMALAQDLQRATNGNGGGKAIGGHEVIHIVHALGKQGLVRFVERKRGAHKELIRISATNPGIYMVHGTLPKPVRPQAIQTPARVAGSGPVERIQVIDIHDHDTTVWNGTCAACKVYHPTGRPHTVHPAYATVATEPEAATEPSETDQSGYPVLIALRARVAAKAASASKAQAYLDAAALLEGIDDEQGQHLLDLAEQYGGESLTLVEAEYLRYAEKETE